MSYVKYHTTDRDRVCKLCNCVMQRNTWGIVFGDVHVPPKLRDLHFHEGCLMRALEGVGLNHPEREAMAKVCEAAQARMDTYDKGEDYTGGIRSVEWDNLRAALADLERARKGEG